MTTPLDKKARRKREAKVSTGFILILMCFGFAPFIAREANRQDGWIKLVDVLIAIALLVLGMVLVWWLSRMSRGTKFQGRFNVLGGLIILVGLLAFVIGAKGDEIAFLSAMAGIGAGVATQAAFHYGLVDPVEEPKAPDHRGRLLEILARARR